MFKLIGFILTPDGAYITLQDAKQKFVGYFCWSREQVEGLASHISDEKIKEEVRVQLTKGRIAIRSSDEPISIHGLCACLLDAQLQRILEFRKTHDFVAPKRFEPKRVVLTLCTEKDAKEHGVLIYYVDALGVVNLAHIRSKAQSLVLVQNTRFPDENTQIIRNACKDLPTVIDHDPKATLISQPIIKDLLTCQIALMEEQVRLHATDVN